MESQRLEEALQLLRSEYADTPGLALTPLEVAEHLALDPSITKVLLRALEYSRFLECLSDGRFALARHPGDHTVES